MVATAVVWSQSQAPVIETAAPDLDAIEVTRKYKVFRAHDKQPISEVTAQISFTPPDMKAYTITQSTGNQRGEKIVRTILGQESDAAKRSDNNQVSRKNYDFAFLRRENFGVVPEYALLIIPKRKAKTLS